MNWSRRTASRWKCATSSYFIMMQRKNGIIAGGTGSGKTTMMKAMLDHIPYSERLCIIEQPAELKVLQPNAVRWEAVEAIPGQVAITPSELLAAALRHRPDRIIMGEIRNECRVRLTPGDEHRSRRNALHDPCKVRLGCVKPPCQPCPECSPQSQPRIHAE